MPELCRFYNIVIKMIFSDTDKHHKPHFHVSVSYTHLTLPTKQRV